MYKHDTTVRSSPLDARFWTESYWLHMMILSWSPVQLFRSDPPFQKRLEIDQISNRLVAHKYKSPRKVKQCQLCHGILIWRRNVFDRRHHRRRLIKAASLKYYLRLNEANQPRKMDWLVRRCCGQRRMAWPCFEPLTVSWGASVQCAGWLTNTNFTEMDVTAMASGTRQTLKNVQEMVRHHWPQFVYNNPKTG